MLSRTRNVGGALPAGQYAVTASGYAMAYEIYAQFAATFPQAVIPFWYSVHLSVPQHSDMSAAKSKALQNARINA